MKKAIALGIAITLLLNFMMLRTALVLASPSGFPNSGFEQGTLGEVPNNWTQELIDFPGENPPPQGYFEHELRQSDAAYYEGNYSLYGRAAFVHTFEKHDNNPTSETWAHSEYIDAENATWVTVHMRGIYRVSPSLWGWNSYIFLVLDDGVNSVEYTLYEYREYPLGHTLEANHYNFTDTGADGQEWYGYTREIPPSLNSINLRVSIGWYAHTWYWYYPAIVEIASYVDQVSVGSTHDIAILSVACDKTAVLPSQDVMINVTAGNQGDFAETFNVTAYANETVIGRQVVSLNARESQILTFEWNTTGFDLGNYTISAVCDQVANETNIADNTCVDGIVAIRSLKHDVAIIDVLPLVTTVVYGDSVSIAVTAQNQGDFVESFNVTVFAGSSKLQTITVTDLESSTSRVMNFEWNTTGYSIGTYVIQAVADYVLGEDDTADNTFVDGTVSIVALALHNADAMWVEPAAIRFNTNTISAGFKFNVTVAMNFTEDVFAWQVVLYYNATQLNCTRVGPTAAPTSEFMMGHSTTFSKALNPGAYPPVNGSLQAIVVCETCSPPDFIAGPHNGTLFWAEFQIILAPSPGTFLSSKFDISTEYAATNTWVWDSNTDSYTFTPYDGTYQFTTVRIDLAVLNVTSYKTVACQGTSLNASVMVANQGDSVGTFNLTAYANTTVMTSQNITLPPGSSTTVTLTWNTTTLAKGNYTLSTYAWPLPDEINTTNNNFTDGWIIVSMFGDLTGGTPNPWDFIPDGKVDGKDIAIVALCYGSAPGCSPPYVWNANCDVNNDGKIDGKDIALVALHYGQADP